jgi:tetratricopeptide (TPR) repeat protein
LRAGNKAEAETLLLRVVAADETHEQAWLWLSGAVQTDEDRRVCLENVLALNPDNAAARQGLATVVAQLDAAEAIAPEPETDDETYRVDAVDEDIPAINLAAALLYPDDPRRKKHQRKAAVKPTREPESSFAATSTFDDVWSQDVELCAYCAHEIDIDDEKCPHCGRKLSIKQFRYEEVSHHLHSFWVLLLGAGQLFLVQALLGIAQDGVDAAVVINFLLMGVYMVLTIAVYQRQVWAHYSAIYLTGAILALVGINRLVFSTFSFIPDIGLKDGAIFFQHIALTGIQMAFYFMLLGSLGLTLVFAVFFVAADFVRDEKRQTAVLQPGINAADRYDNVAVKHAREGRWATAVLHWQRAAAKAPNTFIYQRRLANGYARLGYYERSLSVLNGAIANNSNPEVLGKLEKMKTAVERQQVASGK